MVMFIQRLVNVLRARIPKLMAFLEGELPMVRPENLVRPASKKWRGQIPASVYQAWETDCFGKTHARGLERFRALNPECSFYLFDRAARDSYMEEFYSSHPIFPIYKNANVGSMKVDIWRYCILHERGGIYFDINKCINIPLVDVLNLDDVAVVSYESNLFMDVRPRDISACLPLEPTENVQKILSHTDKPFLNWGLAFCPRHPFLERTIQNIVSYAPIYRGKRFRNARDPVIELTGPHMLTRSIYHVLDENPEVSFRQMGIDFNGQGNPNMDGSWVRYATSKSYARSHNVIVLS